MSDVFEIDHEDTKEVVCPWCGYESRDSWEFDDRGNTECSECGKPYSYERYTDVTYTTWYE